MMGRGETVRSRGWGREGGVGRDRGFSREVEARMEVFLCLPLSFSLEGKEKSNYGAPKDLIIG